MKTNWKIKIELERIEIEELLFKRLLEEEKWLDINIGIKKNEFNCEGCKKNNTYFFDFVITIAKEGKGNIISCLECGKKLVNQFIDDIEQGKEIKVTAKLKLENKQLPIYKETAKDILKNIDILLDKENAL